MWIHTHLDLLPIPPLSFFFNLLKHAVCILYSENWNSFLCDLIMTLYHLELLSHLQNGLWSWITSFVISSTCAQRSFLVRFQTVLLIFLYFHVFSPFRMFGKLKTTFLLSIASLILSLLFFLAERHLNFGMHWSATENNWPLITDVVNWVSVNELYVRCQPI